MLVSLSWLKKIIHFTATAEQLAAALTRLGLETSHIEEIPWACQRVVVGEIVMVQDHPNADRLHLCSVRVAADKDNDPSAGKLLQIVCGAPNARAGIKVAVALVGATLPGDITIKMAKLRGVESYGMLCSVQELGLAAGWNSAHTAHGILELAAEAPVGMDLAAYLGLPDQVLDVELTPNRGDCLSMIGIARELVALGDPCYGVWTEYGRQLSFGVEMLATGAAPQITNLHDSYDSHDLHSVPLAAAADAVPTATLSTSELLTNALVRVEATQLAPHYCVAKLSQINNQLATPDWIKAVLLAAGLHPISLIVDITNFIMLELGQPLHAFDAAQVVGGGLVVRVNKESEQQLGLLNGQTITLQPESLVIADAQRPLALAGVMGGQHSMVTSETNSIFLESAFFQRTKICQESQAYGLSTDASFRYERGVDFELPPIALQRAVTLLQQLAGARLDGIEQLRYPQALPLVPPIDLQWEHIEAVLGTPLPIAAAGTVDADYWEGVQQLLQRLGMQVESVLPNLVRVTPPSYRFDIKIEEDLIEEIARLIGYDQLPIIPLTAPLSYQHLAGSSRRLNSLADRLVEMGYQEAITYSFVDRRLQNKLYNNDCESSVGLVNPIWQDYDCLRTTLWSSLLPVVRHNLQHGQEQLRLFECGRVFYRDRQPVPTGNGVQQPYHLAGVLMGSAQPLHWSGPVRALDFYDLAGDIEQLLREQYWALSYRPLSEVQSLPTSQPLAPQSLKCFPLTALHPHVSAVLYLEQQPVGCLGQLHPQLQRELQLRSPVWLWELDLDRILARPLPHHYAEERSKYPKIQRDLALVVPNTCCWNQLQHYIREAAQLSVDTCLTTLIPFDLYHGAEIGVDCYSLAVRMQFQSYTHTLTDVEVDSWIAGILAQLRQHGVSLRQ